VAVKLHHIGRADVAVHDVVVAHVRRRPDDHHLRGSTSISTSSVITHHHKHYQRFTSASHT
jgi:hypothetical protein